jgi:membrane AbrB-like protein
MSIVYLAVALAIGGAGGAAFAFARLPLAWMIGAMVFTTVASVSGLPAAVPPRLRNAMVVVLGIMLGSAFTPAIIDRLGGWSLSIAGLVISLTVTLLAGFAWLRTVARLDPTTAWFTATPGGLSEMVLVGTAMGGDDRTISLVHASRIMLVVMIVPFWFQALAGYQPAARGPLGPALDAVPLADVLLFALCALGYPLAARLRIPTAQVIGPMMLSAAVHMAGLTAGTPPGVLVAAAQVVMGAAIGCRFRGVPIRRIGQAMLIAVGLTAIMLAVTLASAMAVHLVTGLPLPGLILAYAPGGLAEMSLMALALNADVAFVSTHHMVRIVLVVMVAPAAFTLWRRRRVTMA